MWELVELPIAISLGLIAWPAIVSFRVGRWGQAVLLLVASAVAPLAGLYGATFVMWETLRLEASIGVVVMALVWAWIAALIVPVALGVGMHLTGRFTPPLRAPKPQWRTPDA